MSTCAWCGEQIPDESEVFGLGVRARDRTVLRSHEGKEIPIVLALVDKTVPAIVTTSDSQAKRDGNDLMFMVCSRECGQDLRDALTDERDLFEEIRALNLGPDGPPS